MAKFLAWAWSLFWLVQSILGIAGNPDDFVGWKRLLMPYAPYIDGPFARLIAVVATAFLVFVPFIWRRLNDPPPLLRAYPNPDTGSRQIRIRVTNDGRGSANDVAATVSVSTYDGSGPYTEPHIFTARWEHTHSSAVRLLSKQSLFLNLGHMKTFGTMSGDFWGLVLEGAGQDGPVRQTIPGKSSLPEPIGCVLFVNTTPTSRPCVIDFSIRKGPDGTFDISDWRPRSGRISTWAWRIWWPVEMYFLRCDAWLRRQWGWR